MNKWPSRGTALVVAFAAGVFFSAALLHVASGAQSSASLTREAGLAVETATHLVTIRPHTHAVIDGQQKPVTEADESTSSLYSDLQVADSYARPAPNHAERRDHWSKREHELFDQLMNGAMETMQ